jgi:predicted nucleotide-binding protein (sugar kinase/HSP70/actin superfamily)
LLETDAHTGKAGFGTRIEAFLYGVRNYKQPENEQNLPDMIKFEPKGEVLRADEKRKVLIPWMGEGSILAPALLKTSLGINAGHLPTGDEEALELGRKYTSGKECLPMIVTLGSLLKYLKDHPNEEVVYFLPSANGPCRFGQYHIFTQIVLEDAGLDKRVKVISPNSETGYFLNRQFGPAMRAKAWTTFVFVDLLKDALMEIRPMEIAAGETEKLFYNILKIAEANVMLTPNDWSGLKNLWGFVELAELAIEAFKKIPVDEALEKYLLQVLVTGEVFVRHDEFSNQRIIRQLEALGVKVKLAGFREWINYTLFQRRKKMTVTKTPGWKIYLTWLIQKVIEGRLCRIFAKGFDWPRNHSIDEILNAAKPYLTKLRPQGESALTIGLPLLLHKKKEIKGAVILGPFECMPTRVAEEILSMASEKNKLPLFSVSFRGDPIDNDLLESFVWELREI